MLAFVLALVSWAGERADAAVVGHWLVAATSASQAEKYVALSRGLRAIDQKHYTGRRADLIGLLYGSLLDAGVPAATKWLVCRTLASMDGLDTSVDPLLQCVGRFKVAAAAKKQKDRERAYCTGPFLPFRTGRPVPDEEQLADDLIAALWTRKSGGRSHFSGALVRFPSTDRSTGFRFSG